ncbi:putative NIT2-nitrilase [Tilletiaria anomala UBC 951]|uniref:Putative NIT2-nitrilase n=1 Tax=Tilletiaria anomala (strain ATCC 24038 / CBS 436.72 / UBC 951) TaxID=1037660 RepID=A0A066VE38_TILAU|nr:putative NIT2-nitrilase [Tilletiaria anomala UBC 951]KDN37024.1 putative NIT2-nitrilase [Tilletiaria anomala UBC 951]
MLAAVGQMCSTGQPLANLNAAVSIISRAAAAGAAAVFLPEATDFIAPASHVPALTRSAENRAFVDGLRDAARRHGVEISVGIHEPPASSPSDSDSDAQVQDDKHRKGRCYNTQLLIGSDGNDVQRYRKLHLFDVDIKGGLKILESDTTIPGRALSDAVDSRVGKLGLLTCYDLRFPEPSLSLRKAGAQVLTYPSAFTVRTGAAHWEILLRARAIETQCYVLAAAQVGSHEGTKRVSWGHAMAVDPYGSVIAQCSDMQPYQPSFCLANIDLDLLENVRKEMPLWEQRRPDVYSTI